MDKVIPILLIAVLIVCIIVHRIRKTDGQDLVFDRYDEKGFDSNGVHRNGTKYDDAGYDCKGYNSQGYNRQGYNKFGKNQKGQYNRLFDLEDYKSGQYSVDGFLNPHLYPIALSTHARERILERIEFRRGSSPEKIARDAYQYGKSVRQIKKTSAILVHEIEEKHDGGIVLIYHNFIYVFSKDNVLITVYKNENIPL